MVVRGIGADSLVRLMSEDEGPCPDLAWLLADPADPAPGEDETPSSPD